MKQLTILVACVVLAIISHHLDMDWLKWIFAILTIVTFISIIASQVKWCHTELK